MIRPYPPNETGLHSKISDLVTVDECWAFDQMQGQAIDQGIVPTMATRPNAQTWKVSTAGTANSTWWHGTVEAGRAAVRSGRDSGVAYFEWSCPDHLDPCDPDSWALYHPAYGRTISKESMQSALDQFGPDEFARAYGNRWQQVASRVIPVEAWRRAAEDPSELPQVGQVALGFDAAVDRSDGAVVMCWRDATGLAHLEVADHRPGTGWLAERVAQLVERWRPSIVAYDQAGPTPDIADVLTRNGLELVGLKTGDYVAACASLLEALCASPPAVRYRPHPALDAAAASAVRRAIRDAWGWGRRQSAGSIASLTAATVSLWALDHAPAVIGDFKIY
jgi:hypothetical protein